MMSASKEEFQECFSQYSFAHHKFHVDEARILVWDACTVGMVLRGH
jgi:hypothetical protein